MAATVLVVDDERSQLDVLGRWLLQFGYPFRLAERAHVALEEMAADPADILLVDLIMPEHDGFWLIERVRTQWPRSVIIVATGVQDLDTVEKAKRLGAVDYVTKPFGRELLHQALVRAEGRLGRATNPE
jgi:DNA-binding NtrC family response regulator